VAWIGARVRPEPPAELADQFARERTDALEHAPSFAVTLGTVLLPVVLMLGKALADLLLDKQAAARAAVDFIGARSWRSSFSVIVAMFSFRLSARVLAQEGQRSPGLEPRAIAGIVLIIGAGGGFKQMLIAGGVGERDRQGRAGSSISPLLLGWLIAVASGSRTRLPPTVATVTASGLMAPVPPGSRPQPVPPRLAIGSGSLFFSHVNDAGFWLVKEYFGMTVGRR